MATSLTINLKRVNKIYNEGDVIAGVVVVESGGDVRHDGISLLMEGVVNLQFSTKNVGIFDAFSNNIEPITLVRTSLELVEGGKLPAGRTELPFELPLRARAGAPPLLETYHGVFVNVMYTLKAGMRRSFLNKPLNATCQFFVQQPLAAAAVAKPVRCEITPATIRAGAAAGGAGGAGRGAMPQFQIYAEIDSTVCALDKPLTGKIRVEESELAIKSIELQLVRVETCGGPAGCCRNATEIQNIQVCSGDVCRARDLPLHLVLPRLFTCPTAAAPAFKIEFELNIAVIFEDDHLVTENFPILLLRCR